MKRCWLYTREIDLLPSRWAGPKGTIAEPYCRWAWRRSYEAALRLIASGRLRLEALVTHRLPIEGIAEGYAALRASRGTTLKVLLAWG